MTTLSKRGPAIAFLLPALVIYTAIVVLPIVQAAYLSLTEWNGVSPMRFVGAANYVDVFRDGVFLKSLVNNVVYILVVMSTQIVVGLVVAIMVSYLGGSRDLVRTLYFIPAVITVVAIAQLFRSIYSYEPTGLLNKLLIGLGAKPIPWLSNYTTALPAVSFVEGWQFIGIYLIIFYSALIAVPTDIVEAAQMDGAVDLKLLFYVKLPYIRNVIGLSLILSLVGALRGFAVPLLLTRGGPGSQTEILATYMYKKAFQSIKLGYGSAVAVIIAVISFVGVILIQRSTRTEED
jgi:raffinose/stachyose/melibiose transport system permease protein